MPNRKNSKKSKTARRNSHQGPRRTGRRPNNNGNLDPALRNGRQQHDNGHGRQRRASNLPSYSSRCSENRHNIYKKQLQSIRKDGMAASDSLKRMISTASDLINAFNSNMDWDPTFQVNCVVSNYSPHTPSSSNAAVSSPPPTAPLSGINPSHHHANILPPAFLPISPISPLTAMGDPHHHQTIQPNFHYALPPPQTLADHPFPRAELFACPHDVDDDEVRCCRSAMSDVQPPLCAVEAAVQHHRLASLGHLRPPTMVPGTPATDVNANAAMMGGRGGADGSCHLGSERSIAMGEENGEVRGGEGQEDYGEQDLFEQEAFCGM
ncbi:hypothetical protein GTA08_BOTSDO09715 [Botryosphaeria dothidea]|uniref:Uncharacterized protein n=1 Tax=Botryosphaeria dothidea TaxID=55169 RepID=A0A8H4IJ83_9PEZI|nr:hypothetical protein GTA08_BOTSDO09715 [Botryosphaeria dothidea]